MDETGTPATPIPDPAVVVLVGAAGAGKSHWAAQHYRKVEIVSSDRLRSIVGSGPADLDATDDAFDLLDRIVAVPTAARAGGRRSARGRGLGPRRDHVRRTRPGERLDRHRGRRTRVRGNGRRWITAEPARCRAATVAVPVG